MSETTTIGGGDGFEIRNLVVPWNPDPSISYSLDVADIGAASSFSFTFTSPIVPTANPASVQASYSASFTKPQAGTYSVTPTRPDLDGDGILEIQTFDVYDGTYKNAGVDLGAAYSAAVAGGTSDGLPSEASGWLPAPAGGPFTSLRLEANFNLNGNGDVYTADGFAEIGEQRVPVPDASSTIALFGLACAGLGLFASRRR